MNEQIRKLFLKSLDANQEFCYQKFAKLIILECADFVAAGEFGDPGAARELRENFGVEEKNNE
jgi:hypothetical protein